MPQSTPKKRQTASEKCDSSRFGNLEAVSSSAHRFKVAGFIWIYFDLLTNAANVDVHRARRHVVCVAPYRIKQLVAGEYSAGMAGHVFQQSELSSGGLGQRAADGQGHTATVDLDITSLHNRRC